MSTSSDHRTAQESRTVLSPAPSRELSGIGYHHGFPSAADADPARGAIRPATGTMEDGAASPSRVLVIGTTPDYVDLLRRDHPRQCLFLTDSRLRLEAKEPCPNRDEEILYRHPKQLQAIELLDQYQKRHAITIAGIACFDCESMPLASVLAKKLQLPYPSPAAIHRCRNKYTMKQTWHANGIPIPRFAAVGCSEEAIQFFRRVDRPCVMKPFSGSGSELVFRIDNVSDCERVFERIISQLQTRRSAPLYRSCRTGFTRLLMEEYIGGPEYSGDFLIQDGQVHVIRLTRKHAYGKGPFGTIEAYELEPDCSAFCQESRLKRFLLDAALALGIERAICMADFIMVDHQPVFLELTPRCGGDCLPFLLKATCGIDMLGLVLQFARGPIDDVPTCTGCHAVALRLFAHRSGILETMDLSGILDDPRVVSATMTKRVGDLVRLPPADYDSWILGHILYRPRPGSTITEQNQEFLSRFQMKIADP